MLFVPTNILHRTGVSILPYLNLIQKCIEQSDTKLYENIFVYSLLKPVFYLQKMMNFMKMRTFYKKLPLFIKNSILHT